MNDSVIFKKDRTLTDESMASLVFPAVAANVGLAVSFLQKKEVIALPSDTLYGLAADAWYFSLFFLTTSIVITVSLFRREFYISFLFST